LRVFWNRVLGTIFVSETEEVTGGWRKLHSKEHHNLYSSSNIVRVLTSSKMRWVPTLVTCMVEMGMN
jgi:hypothetical protein